MTKICTKCKKELPITHFHKARNSTRSECKTCRNSYLREWAKKNPEKKKAQKLRHRYGIGTKEYNSLFNSQGGKCGYV